MSTASNTVAIQPEQIISLIKELIPAAKHARLHQPCHLLEEGILDSLAFIQLLGLLEERFSLEIDPDTLDIQHLVTIEAITRWIENQKRG